MPDTTVESRAAANATRRPAPGHLARTRRPVITLVAIIIASALQWWVAAVPTTEAEAFDRWAVEIGRRGPWRYGYVQAHHGAVIVKAPLRADAPPLVPRDDDPLTPVMTRELRTRFWKAGLELGLYVGLLVLWRHRFRSLTGGPAAARTRTPRLAGAALSGVVVVTIALAPYLVTGYGEPLFSTWQGPGALTYSSLVPTTGPLTTPVSYRLLLEAVLIWPLMVAQWAAEPLSAWLGIRASLWIVAASFWGGAAAIAAAATIWTTPATGGEAAGVPPGERR